MGKTKRKRGKGNDLGNGLFPSCLGGRQETIMPFRSRRATSSPKKPQGKAPAPGLTADELPDGWKRHTVQGGGLSAPEPVYEPADSQASIELRDRFSAVWERVLALSPKEDDRSVPPVLNDGLSETEIQTAEEEVLRFRLPEDMRALYKKMDGEESGGHEKKEVDGKTANSLMAGDPFMGFTSLEECYYYPEANEDEEEDYDPLPGYYLRGGHMFAFHSHEETSSGYWLLAFQDKKTNEVVYEVCEWNYQENDPIDMLPFGYIGKNGSDEEDEEDEEDSDGVYPLLQAKPSRSRFTEWLEAYCEYEELRQQTGGEEDWEYKWTTGPRICKTKAAE